MNSTKLSLWGVGLALGAGAMVLGAWLWNMSAQTASADGPKLDSAIATSSSTMATPSTNDANLQTATFGGGCFWCAEAVFQRIPGVKSVVSGFAGGTVPNPSYELVCTGTTGHAEVIQIKFDPAVISYDKILEIFWDAHDPTTLNRQGNDEGTQYRSIILYADETQHQQALASKAAAQKNYKDPIVTEIVPLKAFYSAEDYHQNYYNLHKNGSYCAFVITPKLKKLVQEGVIPQDK